MQQRKELGQHWLKDKHSLESMVEAAEVHPGDAVLEIGPGTGLLTDELLATGASVTALEFDHTLKQQLIFKYAGNKDIELIEGDIRSFNLGNLSADYKIVANIPYYLTANLMRKLVDDEHKPTVASLLVQKEVAERIGAQPGKLSAIAVMVQIYYGVNIGILVPAHLFEPPPKVDSQILVLKLRDKPLIEQNDIEGFFKLIKSGFSQPRKKLISNLKTSLNIDEQKLKDIFQKLKLDVNTRAQELSLEQWASILLLLN